MNEKNFTNKIEELKPWFHNLHLPGGEQTAPDHFLGDFPNFKWLEIASAIPDDLTGWRVLDIGCNAGFYTFKLAERGADVLGIDLDPHYLEQAKWAAGVYGLEDKVRFKQMQVYDLAHLDEQFDMVWFMGVLYHLRYPLLALDIVTQKARKMMVFQTLTMPGQKVADIPANMDINNRQQMQLEGWPQMAFIEEKLAGDITNWWAPNHAAIEGMLRTCGMRITNRPGHEIYICGRDKNLTPVAEDWNKSEYLSAIGKTWKAKTEGKVVR